MFRRIILFIVISFFFVGNTKADYLLHDIPNLNNQLSNNAILSMCQDSYGFMWFGSYDGLNFYDGKEVSTFRFDPDNPNSISGNSIHNISIADRNHLWIATQLGLDKFSLTEKKVVESYKDYKKVQYLAIKNNNETWVLGKNHYISYYNNSSEGGFEEISFDELILNQVHTLFVDGNQQLCLINKGGELIYINYKENKRKKKELILKKVSLHNKKIKNLFQDGKYIYLLDDDNNLYVYNSSSYEKDYLCNITDIIEKYGHSLVSLTSLKNDLYIAFLNGGLIELNITSKQWKSINSTVGIFSILKDKNQDAIWVATDGKGVQLYYREENSFGNILLKDLPFVSERPVRAIYTDEKDNLWIGTKGDGIIRIKNYVRYKDIAIPIYDVDRLSTGTFIYCFKRSEYNKNDLWMCGDRLSYYSYKNDKIYDITLPKEFDNNLNDIHNLVEVNDSILWMTCDGLWRIEIDKTKTPYVCRNAKKQTLIKDGNILKDVFFSMFFDNKSNLSLGSRVGFGILEYDISKFKYNYRTVTKGIGDIICLYPKSDSILYIGTSAGLYVENLSRNKNNVKHFGRKDGIMNDMIHGILEDRSGIIWLTTNKGLVKYNPQNDFFFNFQSHKIGVSEFSDNAYWQCPISGRLFFGGINGITWIEPNSTKEEDERYDPNIIFTNLKMFDTTTSLYEYNNDRNRKIVISEAQSSFTISFAILDYIDGENYDNSYMLEGYDSTWIYIQKNNNIQLIKIPPGKYTLKVRYRNDIANTNNKIFSIPITILPPWYRTTLAYIIYIVMSLTLIASLIFYLKWKFKRKQEILAIQIKSKERELLYESKMSFFTNITHELFTPLTLINGALEQIEKSKQASYPSKYIDIMQNNVDSLNELIQEILDYRKIEEGHLKELTISKVQISDLIYSLLNSYTALIKSNNIKIETSIPNNLYWNTDKNTIKKIIVNLLSNAFKYTPKDGFIIINANIDDNSNLIFSVSNSGKGIKKDKLEKIFNRFQILEDTNVNANNQMTARNGLGLYICYTMVQHLNGVINVDSEVDGYTEFRVILPLLEMSDINNEEIEADEIKINIVDNNIKAIQNVTTELSSSILIIDDNKDIVELLADILSSFYSTFKAYSVKEALAILKNNTPTLIITDIMMPDTGGLSFIDSLRNDKFYKNIPIIALSAKVNENDIIDGYTKGADAYITKPFSTDILLSIVKRLIINKEEIKRYYNTAESAYSYSSEKLLHVEDKEFIQKVSAIVKDNISNPQLGPDFIADKMNISSRTLYRQLKKILSISVSDFIRDFKLTYASRLLLTTNLTIKEIIYKIGFTNKTYFYNEFSKKFSKTPKEFRDTDIDNLR